MSEIMSNYNPNEYPPFAVTADIAVFTLRDGALNVLLVERGGEPYLGCWALPGGFLGADESADEAAERELEEETGLVAEVSTRQQKIPGSVHLEQLGTFSSPKRDPRMRVVSVAYVALAADLGTPIAGDDAAYARWWAVEDILSGEIELAFDHFDILTLALERVRSKLEYSTLATQFVGEEFTLGELYRVYRAVWGENAVPTLQNFRRKVLSVNGFVEQVDGYSEGGAGPKARLYTSGDGWAIQPAMLREVTIGSEFE